MTQGKHAARPGPRQVLGKWWLPLSQPPQPEGLAPLGDSARIRTRQVGRRPAGPRPTPEPGPSRPRAPCRGRRQRPPRSRPPARPTASLSPAAAPRCALGPASAQLRASLPDWRGRGRAAAQGPGLPSTANPPETSVRPVLPGLRLPTPGRRRGVSLRAAYAASGWRVACTEAVRLAGSRNFPSAPRSLPPLPERQEGDSQRDQ